MGCDGGSIPRRIEMVREKAKPTKEDPSLVRKARWFNCAITQEKLNRPIVGCRKGRLYNKENLLEHVLGIKKSRVAMHIKKKRDMKTLRLTENPNYNKGAQVSSKIGNFTVSQFMCPLTSVEMNGMHRFGFFWNCGCVFSERGLLNLKSAKLACPYCDVNDKDNKTKSPADTNSFIYINEDSLTGTTSMVKVDSTQTENTKSEDIKTEVTKVNNIKNDVNNVTIDVTKIDSEKKQHDRSASKISKSNEKSKTKHNSRHHSDSRKRSSMSDLSSNKTSGTKLNTVFFDMNEVDKRLSTINKSTVGSAYNSIFDSKQAN